MLKCIFWQIFRHNQLKCGQICLEFWPVMQYIVMHQAYNGFHFILKKHLQWSQKIDFLAHFERFLVYAFLCPMIYTLVCFQIKRVMEVHNCVIISLVQHLWLSSYKFSNVLWNSSIHEMFPYKNKCPETIQSICSGAIHTVRRQ